MVVFYWEIEKIVKNLSAFLHFGSGDFRCTCTLYILEEKLAKKNPMFQSHLNIIFKYQRNSL